LRAVLAHEARYVLLSAVAPNIADMTHWIGTNPGSAVIEQRSTRMKVGVYKIRREGRFNRGVIDYVDGTQLRVFERGVSAGKQAALVQLAHRLGLGGPVLVVARGQGTAETIATALCERIKELSARPLTEEQLEAPVMQRLDARLEREMYASVSLRKLIA